MPAPVRMHEPLSRPASAGSSDACQRLLVTDYLTHPVISTETVPVALTADTLPTPLPVRGAQETTCVLLSTPALASNPVRPALVVEEPTAETPPSALYLPVCLLYKSGAPPA